MPSAIRTVTSLSELDDVNSGTIANGDVLKYDGGTGKVVGETINQIAPQIATMLTGLDVTFQGTFIGTLIVEVATQANRIGGSHASNTQATFTPNTYIGVQNFSYSEGTLVAAYDPITKLQFDNLQYAATFSLNSLSLITEVRLPELLYAGALTLSTLASCTTIELPKLAQVNSMSIAPGNATTISLPLLTTVVQTLSVNGVTVTTLDLPSLVTVGSSFTPSNMSLLTTLNVPNLTKVGQSCNPSSMTTILSISFPALTTVGGQFNLTTFPALTSLSIPNLSFVGSAFAFSSVVSLGTISAPALATVNSSISCTSCTALTTFSIPALANCTSGINLSTSNGNIANVTLGTVGTTKLINGAVNLSGQKLTTASVDNCLTLLASLDGTNGTTLYGTGKTVSLNGGTNAAPTFTGSTASKAGSSFVGVGTTCTATITSHGYSTGDLLTITGITSLTNANGTFQITVTNANVFTFTIVSQSLTGGGTASIKKAGNTTEGYYRMQQLVVRGATVTTN